MSVEIDKNGDIWTIINDRSDARNAVDTDHAKALVSAFDAFENGPAKVAVFWGRGGNFCAGWDLKLAASLSNDIKREAYFDELAFPIGHGPTERGPVSYTHLTLPTNREV